MRERGKEGTGERAYVAVSSWRRFRGPLGPRDLDLLLRLARLELPPAPCGARLRQRVQARISSSFATYTQELARGAWIKG